MKPKFKIRIVEFYNFDKILLKSFGISNKSYGRISPQNESFKLIVIIRFILLTLPISFNCLWNLKIDDQNHCVKL